MKVRIAVAVCVLTLCVPSIASAGETSNSRRYSSTTTTTKVGSVRKEEAATDRLARIKSAGIAAVDKRIAALDKTRARVDKAERMTDAHKQAALALIDNAKSGLNDKKTQIQSATTIDQARPALKAVVDEYRIFVLLLPQVHQARASDAVTNAATKLDEIATALDGVIGQQKAAGKDVAAAEAAVKKAHDEAKLAKDTVSGNADAVLALKANAYPINKTTLDEARAATKSAREHLKASRDALTTAKDATAKNL